MVWLRRKKPQHKHKFIFMGKGRNTQKYVFWCETCDRIEVIWPHVFWAATKNPAAEWLWKNA